MSIKPAGPGPVRAMPLPIVICGYCKREYKEDGSGRCVYCGALQSAISKTGNEKSSPKAARGLRLGQCVVNCLHQRLHLIQVSAAHQGERREDVG